MMSGRFTYALTIACGLTMAFAGLSSAQTGKNGVFTIHNDTKANTVTGFYTNDGSGWSKNWLSEDLEPGETAKAEFNDATGNCKQMIRVGWLGKKGGEVKDDPIRIDFCKASNVYLNDNEIFFD
jgi:hypothetical protein